MTHLDVGDLQQVYDEEDRGVRESSFAPPPVHYEGRRPPRGERVGEVKQTMHIVAQKIVDGKVFMAFVIEETLQWFVWALPLAGVTGVKVYSGGVASLSDAKAEAQRHFDRALKEHLPGG